MTDIEFSEWLSTYLHKRQMVFEGESGGRQKEPHQHRSTYATQKSTMSILTNLYMVKRIKRTYRVAKYAAYKETLVDYREKFCHL